MLGQQTFMIRFYNEETQTEVQAGVQKYQGYINYERIYKMINEFKSQLNLHGSVLQAEVTYYDEGKCVHLYLTSGFKRHLSEHEQLKIRILSYNYLVGIENTINGLFALGQDQKQLEVELKKFLVNQEESSDQSVIKIDIYWSSPLYRNTGNQLQATFKKNKCFKTMEPLVKQIQMSEKKIKLSIRQFRRDIPILKPHPANLPRIVYINTHAQWFQSKLTITGEGPDGVLEQFELDPDSNDLPDEMVDLVILQSSHIEEFAKRLQKVSNNLIVICSNVFCSDPSVAGFLKSFFGYLLTNSSIQASFKEALAEVQKDSSLAQTRCCCFHNHNANCAANSHQYSKTGMFRKYHKKFHHKFQSQCPQLELRNGNPLSQCCCPTILQTSILNKHSLADKFKLWKYDQPMKFNFSVGAPKCDYPSSFMKSASRKLVNSRKQHLQRMVKYVYDKSPEHNSILWINLYGTQGIEGDKVLLADHLKLVLVRKKLIGCETLKMESNANQQTILEQIKAHDFILIQNPLPNMRTSIPTESNATKVIVLVSENKYQGDNIHHVELGAYTLKDQKKSMKEDIKKQGGDPRSPLHSKKSEEDKKLEDQINTSPLTLDMMYILWHFQRVPVEGVAQIEAIARQHHEKSGVKCPSVPITPQCKIKYFTVQGESWVINTQAKSQYMSRFSSQPGQLSDIIRKICHQYLLKFLLSQAITLLRKQEKQSSRLYQVSTLNPQSILNHYLKQKYPNLTGVVEKQPTLNAQCISKFVESVCQPWRNFKDSTQSFLILVCLVLNFDLITEARPKPLYEKVLQNVSLQDNPSTQIIFLQLIISAAFIKDQFQDFSQDKKSWKRKNLQRCIEAVSLTSTNKFYKCIASFNILMGYLLLFTGGWQILDETSADKQNILRDRFDEYESSLQRISSYQEDVKALKGQHGFKFNFVKLLVANRQFQAMCAKYCVRPSALTKKENRQLSIYLNLLAIRNKIKDMKPSSMNLKELQKQKAILQTTCKADQESYLKYIKTELRNLMLAKIEQLNRSTCKFLRHYSFTQVDKVPTVIVEMGLSEKVSKKLGLVVQEAEFTQQSLKSALYTGCQYLVIWLGLGTVKSISNQKADKPMDCLLETLTEVLQKPNDGECKARNIILCSYTIAIERVAKLLLDYKSKLPLAIICFDFSKIPAMQPPAYDFTLKSLFMGLFLVHFAKGAEAIKNKLGSSTGVAKQIPYIVRKASEIVSQKLKLKDLQSKCYLRYEGDQCSSRYSRGPSTSVSEQLGFDETYFSYTLYLGPIDCTSRLLEILTNRPKQNTKSIIVNIENTKNAAKSTTSFLDFFQKMCGCKLLEFPGGVYRVDCTSKSWDKEPMEPIDIIEEKLKFFILQLKDKGALLILQNFDKIETDFGPNKTYGYLCQIINDGKNGIRYIMTSEGKNKCCQLKSNLSPFKLQGEKGKYTKSEQLFCRPQKDFFN